MSTFSACDAYLKQANLINHQPELNEDCTDVLTLPGLIYVDTGSKESGGISAGGSAEFQPALLEACLGGREGACLGGREGACLGGREEACLGGEGGGYGTV